MKFKIREHEGKLLEHVVLHCFMQLSKEAQETAVDNHKEEGTDVKLLIEGVEVDITSFMEHWQSQVGTMITKKAKQLLDDKMSEVSDLLEDLKNRIQPEIDKRLEEWEHDN
jgi:gas vesicle protein